MSSEWLRSEDNGSGCGRLSPEDREMACGMDKPDLNSGNKREGAIGGEVFGEDAQKQGRNNADSNE